MNAETAPPAEAPVPEAAAAVAITPAINLVPIDAPWKWLAAGWTDLMAAPHVGFVYGGAVVLAGWVLVVLLLQAGIAWAILPATAGFFVVAPLVGAGLYEVSRRRERGEEITFFGCAYAFRRNGTQLALIGALLLLIHLFWIRIAGLLFALFFGLGFSPAIETLPIAMLRSDSLLPFLIVGTGFGFVLATVSFAVSAVSIPMIVDRDVSAFEAVVASVTAVVRNPRAMAFWAGLIVVFTGMALVPFFLGLALVLPLIGHATWHAYRDLVR